MKKINKILVSLTLYSFYSSCWAINYTTTIKVGAACADLYVPLVRNKRVGLLTNHTACVGKQHLIDILIKNSIKVQKIFTPEHGFYGAGAAGQMQHDSSYTIDQRTKVPIISLYGKKKKPSAHDLADIDILIFDLQDVGARFYTYISTLQYFMEAAAENSIPLIILDRPNPNGFYVDGPVAEKSCYSFVGRQPIPIVHGMTIGEYARMLNGERWLAQQQLCNLIVIPCKNYGHKDYYKLPIPPSPNLKTMAAIYNYPSLCFFEGTPISVGRGTNTPFELFGHPLLPATQFSFKPQAQPVCYGVDLTQKSLNPAKKINLFYLKQAYQLYPDKNKFFTPFFNKLAGTPALAQQISTGCSEEKIRASWEPALSNFKKIRKKYLLYEDFE